MSGYIDDERLMAVWDLTMWRYADSDVILQIHNALLFF